MSDYQATDRGDLRKYRIELPNLVDDMDLSVYAFRLYSHLKRVASDSGMCWQSTETLAQACHMSAGAVSKAKDDLVKAGLIHIEEQQLDRGGRAAHHIFINDIWLENFIKYSSNRGATSLHELGSSSGELPSSPHEQASSPHEVKKEPLSNKKEPNKKKESDPLLNNPAIVEYREITRQHVPIVLREEVAGTVTDLKLWCSIVRDWIGYGWNKGNVKGMLEAYRAGGIQRSRGNGFPTGKQKTAAPKKSSSETRESIRAKFIELWNREPTEVEYQKAGVL
jgi:hypothetical protein